MFQWKPPDPRLVALARRLEAEVRRLLGEPPANVSANSDPLDHDGASNDAVHEAGETRDDPAGEADPTARRS